MVREEIKWNHTNMCELKPEKAEKGENQTCISLTMCQAEFQPFYKY